jgi:hypothetical protein
LAKKKNGNKATYKYIKDIYGRMDLLQQKIELIIEFLGGEESMKKVLEDAKNGRPKY